MDAPLPVFRIVPRALGVAFRHLGVLLPLAALVAIPATALRDGAVNLFLALASGWLPAHGVLLDPQQAPILAMVAADMVVLPWACIAGAFSSAAVIHVFMRDEADQAVSLGQAIEFGVKQFSRVIRPFTAAVLVIWVGSIVIIPGVLYTIFYAFVVPVAVLQPDVKNVLRRSTMFTRGRRGRIFRTFLAFIWWWGWYATVGPLVLAGTHWGLRHLAAVADGFVGFILAMALLQLYLERLRQAEARRAEQQAASGGKQPIHVP